MKEIDLAQKFVKHLSNFDLYFEVQYFRIVDIVGIADKYSFSVEVKTTFNFKVLEQAIENRKHFNYSYIACPSLKDYYIQEKLCSDYGIGLLVYCSDSVVREVVKPKLNRHSCLSHLKTRLSDSNKLAIPGAKSGEAGRVTAFQVTVESIERCVRRNPGIPFKQLMEKVEHHYSSNGVARACIRSYINSGVIKQVQIKDNRVYLIKEF